MNPRRLQKAGSVNDAEKQTELREGEEAQTFSDKELNKPKAAKGMKQIQNMRTDRIVDECCQTEESAKKKTPGGMRG